MPSTPFSACRYSAFFSYAHADDEAWRDWVTDFCDEFEKSLSSFLHGIRIPPVHLSSENGPINGPLNDALRRNLESAFAVVVFVHNNYLASAWCLQEIRHFKTLFGEEGFRERLYIVAMSRPAIETLTRQPSWRELFPYTDEVWMPFFQEGREDRPVNIYADDTRKRRLVVSNDFWDRFIELRDDLAAKIRAAVEAEQQERTYPASVAPAAPPAAEAEADRQLVRVYIEANVEQQRFWEPLGQQIVIGWDQVIAQEHEEPPLRLRPTGLPMDELDARPVLDDADGVVLLWGKKTPDSLAAQIAQVEPKLSGPRFAPGLIAYLMDGPADQPARSTVNYWPVVRFLTRPDGSATLLADDTPQLARFLREVLRHKRAGA